MSSISKSLVLWGLMLSFNASANTVAPSVDVCAYAKERILRFTEEIDKRNQGKHYEEKIGINVDFNFTLNSWTSQDVLSISVKGQEYVFAKLFQFVDINNDGEEEFVAKFYEQAGREAEGEGLIINKYIKRKDVENLITLSIARESLSFGFRDRLFLDGSGRKFGIPFHPYLFSFQDRNYLLFVLHFIGHDDFVVSELSENFQLNQICYIDEFSN
ncbi:hypothetical protein OQJ46_04560 [Microbulbifer thermotolerans]|uniref:EF-hand domain-containing protein n=1 Tax=Microbulbifer thermotolerans TaxID=252514 RepID=A0AB35I159_MICTH|nr:hypothetical protein [Microbulbifer thermotolerans]MCX2782264.1 hypothetical protein [Microbulbifer thermotolerans]MCX2802428.1 hypothetical protein [Microbulbifer thermotolerans]MCX2832353.1 hypothetical protein [Microbulbifer thermotolerans]